MSSKFLWSGLFLIVAMPLLPLELGQAALIGAIVMGIGVVLLLLNK